MIWCCSSRVASFRASVIEWLMVNHPHDCPVCEEGGECHLQDMTMMTGHAYRRYRFTKRTHRNPDLGPFIKHEMNRCIACYRCVRFYGDYAGGRDLDERGSRVVRCGRGDVGDPEHLGAAEGCVLDGFHGIAPGGGVRRRARPWSRIALR